MSRINKNLTGLTLALVLALGVAACDSFLDVNEDPNNPQSVRMDLVVPGMLINFAHEVLGPTWTRYVNVRGPSGWGPEWLQQFSDNRDRHTYAQSQWYDVDDNDPSVYWNNSYSRVLNQAKNIMAWAAEQERWQTHGIAKFITAWNYSLLTDAYGPIVFTEALEPANWAPAYDSQETVYAALFPMIDDAIAEMRMSDAIPPASGDILFQGDMDAWVRLAYSVKARLHMRLTYAPGENPQQRAQAALDALALGIQSPAQAPTIDYDGDAMGNVQPWYTYETSSEGTGIRTRSSKYYIAMLKAHQDPRIHIMANPADWWCPAELPYAPAACHSVSDSVNLEPIYRGNQSGGRSEPDSAISRLGSFFTADSASHVWFTYEDTKFLEAEARLIVNGAAAADAPYREGIRANMERLGVPQADINAYLAKTPQLGSQGSALEQLITEKFKANFLRDEIWHDWRRTGYPVVPPVADRVIDGIPVRIRTPGTEALRNADQVAATGIPTGHAGMLVPVWWASGSKPPF